MSSDGLVQGSNLHVSLLRPADIVLFHDKHSPADPDRQASEPPVNRVAVVVGDCGALSVRRGVVGRRVETISLQALPILPHVQVRRLSHRYSREVAKFFVSHVDRPTHFEAGLRALLHENWQPIIFGSFFPSPPTYRTTD